MYIKHFILSLIILFTAVISQAETFNKNTILPCNVNMTEGQICWVQNLNKIHPTQFNYGEGYVDELLFKYKHDAIYQNYLNNRLFKLIIGPNQIMYIPDGHHHLTTAYKLSKLQHHPYIAYFKIIKHFPSDNSPMAMKRFWQWMEKNNNVWLKNLGNEESPSQLPQSLANLTNDKYRTLAGWLEEAKWCYNEEEGDLLNFSEFYWADYFRNLEKEGKITPYSDPNPNTNAGKKQIQHYLSYINSSGFCHASAARQLPGYCASNDACSKNN